MRRLTLLLVSLVLLSIQSVLAQSFRVKGTVVSAEDNEPMIGVTIKQEGTSNGVVTDIDGNYIIEIKGASKATLAYSYVGCLTQKHVVKEQTNTLNITLAPDSKMMDEVVVVAYGVRKKGTIAGSVSAVKAEKIVTRSRLCRRARGCVSRRPCRPFRSSRCRAVRYRKRGYIFLRFVRRRRIRKR